MNLSSYHCKLLQRTWKEMREEKFKQIERPILWSLSYSPDQALIYKPSTSLGVTYTWNDKLQQDLYEIVLAFVDTSMKDLKQKELRLQLRTRCRRFGRQMAAAFRAMDIDQSLSWEMLGQSMLESFTTSFRNNATKIFLWQLFLEHISAMVFEAFCWAVARDYTSTPLPTIYETDLKQCFPHLTTIERKTPILKKIIAKFARFSKSLSSQSPSPSKKANLDRSHQIQQHEKRRQHFSGPARMVPKNAETYRALYPYKPEHSDELELQENDIIFVVEKCDDGWFIGTCLI
uniref:SH3 domain-containing protein n=1 Tax=Panagrolaimus sp. PS1159 TaxID=55785 RepID=A0AC35FKR0_9BILA